MSYSIDHYFSGFSGALQWKYVALSAFAMCIRPISRCYVDPNAAPISFLTRPCKALHFYNQVLSPKNRFQEHCEENVFGGLLLREMERADVDTNAYVWKFLEWAAEQKEEGKGSIGFGSMGGEGEADLDPSISDMVFQKRSSMGVVEERKRCKKQRNKKRESVVEQWGLREMWAEQERRDREEREERRKREEEEERKKYWYMQDAPVELNDDEASER